jgi:hypothetical protein
LRNLNFIYFFSLQIFVYIIGIYLSRNTTTKFKPGFYFILLLYFIYNIFVPFIDFNLSINSFFGFQFTNEQILLPQQGLVYSIGILSFFLGYFCFKTSKNPGSISNLKSDIHSKLPDYMAAIQVFIWLLVLINFQISGISVGNLFDLTNQNESDLLFSAQWKYPLVDLISNCIPVCLFIQYKFSKKINWKWVVLFSFWLFISLLSGWRYRIILFFLFFVIDFLVQNKWSFFKIFVGVLFLSIALSWLTLNRMAIAKRQFHLITFDLSLFDIRIFTTEFSNSRTFKATCIYLNNHPDIEALGPESWIKFIENKLKPKTEFQNLQRPKPWILEVTKAWIPPGWPWNPNPAVSQMEEFFLTFGWIGLVIGMFVVGIWVGFLDLAVNDPIFQNFKIVGIALLFQWTTRGFFLYQLQITLICFLPFLLLWLAKPYLNHVAKRNTA